MELKQSGEQYHIMAGARISDDEIWLHWQKIGSDYDGAVKMKREGGKWHFAANRFFFPPYKDITAICLYTDSFRDIKRTVPSILDEKLEERSYDDFREYYSQYPVITRTADYSLIYVSDAEWLERAAQDPLIEERLLQIDKKLSDEKLTEEYRILYIPEQGRELIFGTGNHKLRSFGEYDRLREIRGNRDLEASELEAFQSFFSCNYTSYPFPIMFLLSSYDDPRNIDLHILFYNGDGGKEKISEKEEAAIYAAGGPREFGIQKRTQDGMNAVLQKYTGISLKDTNQIGLNSFRTLEGWDGYYTQYTDMMWVRPIFTRGCMLYGESFSSEEDTQPGNTDTLVALEWEDEDSAPKGVVILRRDKGEWMIQANFLLEPVID